MDVAADAVLLAELSAMALAKKHALVIAKDHAGLHVETTVRVVVYTINEKKNWVLSYLYSLLCQVL